MELGGDFEVQGFNEIWELILEMCVHNVVAVWNTYFLEERYNQEYIDVEGDRRIWGQQAEVLHFCITSSHDKDMEVNMLSSPLGWQGVGETE